MLRALTRRAPLSSLRAARRSSTGTESSSQKFLTPISLAVATGLGVVTVGAVASTLSHPRDSQGNTRKFDGTNNCYDPSTFMGRLRMMMGVVDPSTLLATKKEVEAAVALLEEWKAGSSTASDEELWAAMKLRDGAVHPDTGEIIPRPFRMAGYVPYNGPVCVAMILAKSTPALLFFNWVNQSQNALVNYFNRNATNTTSTETLVISYLGAVGSALAVVLGLSQLIRRRFEPEKATRLLKFIAFPSSMVASSLNCYIVRRPEIGTGITLQDSEGRDVAGGTKSKVAAAKAVQETLLSRMILQTPVFLIPALFTSLPPMAALAVTAPAVAMPISTFVAIVSFGIGLPMTLAMFPQVGTVDVEKLEDEFQGLPSPLFYNKGL